MRFLKSICAATVVLSTLCYSLPNQSEARSLTSADRAVAGNSRAVSSAPDYCAATHDVGRIALGVTNHGVSGKGLIVGSTLDCFTGTAVPRCVFPKGSTVDYLFGSSVWVGAVVGDAGGAEEEFGELGGGFPVEVLERIEAVLANKPEDEPDFR